MKRPAPFKSLGAYPGAILSGDPQGGQSASFFKSLGGLGQPPAPTRGQENLRFIFHTASTKTLRKKVSNRADTAESEKFSRTAGIGECVGKAIRRTIQAPRASGVSASGYSQAFLRTDPTPLASVEITSRPAEKYEKIFEGKVTEEIASELSWRFRPTWQAASSSACSWAGRTP